MTLQVISADYLLTPEHFPKQLVLKNQAVIIENGWIKAIVSLDALTADQKKIQRHYPDALLCPGFVNSHNHSFQSLLKGFCDDEDFFTWRDQALYKYATKLSWEDLYHGALFAFGEMLKTGITTVCDFFYINDQANENARAIIQAAQDLGIRLVIARTLYDWDGAPVRFRETIDQACANTDALIAETRKQYADTKMVSVLPAPHSLHGASLPLIEAGRDLAEKWDTPCHMHVAEGEYERKMMLDKYQLSPIHLLAERGVLNHRFVGIHCVWLDDADIALMAKNGASLSYNPSSNMFLGDGVTRIKEMLEAGVRISLGTDGGCSNNRASIIEEMRMASMLQKVVHCNSTVTKAEDMLLAGTVNGAKNLNLPVGQITPGFAADLTVVDLNDLSMQPCLFDADKTNMVKNLVYSSQPSSIQAVYVHGKLVVENGQIQTVSESSIVESIRKTTRRW